MCVYIYIYIYIYIMPSTECCPIICVIFEQMILNIMLEFYKNDHNFAYDNQK
jgi:hypothetical protein